MPLVYARTVLQAPRSRQTARLLATVTPGEGLHPRNFEHRFGSYYEVYIGGGDVHVRRSYAAVPPFAYDVAATDSGTASYPWLYLLPRAEAVLLWTEGGADSYGATSYDEGLSFSEPELMFTGGVYPFGAVNPYDGTELIAAWITATGKIHGRRRQAGDAAYGSEFAFKDDGGGDMLFEDDTFSFWWGYESPNRLVGHFHLQSEGATSTWWSADRGATWTRIT